MKPTPPPPWNPNAPCNCPAQPEQHWHPYPNVLSMSPPASKNTATEITNGYSMTLANPTSAEIREVIAHLRTLADTFPGIIHAANGLGLSGSPINTMGALDRAGDMLRLHASREQDRETEREKQRGDELAKNFNELITLAVERGKFIGIEQEKNRAKEARKGRKRGAKS